MTLEPFKYFWPALATLVSIALNNAQLCADVPSALRKAHEARTPKTGFLRYRQTRSWSDAADQVQILECRFALDNLQFTNLGNDDGLLIQNPDGTPAIGVRNAFLPERTVVDRRAGKTWSHWGSYTHLGSFAIERGPQFIDPRIIGLNLLPLFRKSPQDLLEMWQQEGAGKFQQIIEKDFTKVFHSVSSPEEGLTNTTEWLIDPARDFAVLSITSFRQPSDGAKTMGCRLTSDHTKIDGHWWPQLTECVCSESGLRFKWELEHAEFERPNHPKMINPDSLDVPAGVIVYSEEFKKNRDSRGVYVGDGRAVSMEEWEKIKGDFDLTELEVWKKECNDLGTGYYPAWWAQKDSFGMKDVAQRPTEWEAYVRRWIMKYSNGQNYKLSDPLEEKQKGAARAILVDCAGRAAPLHQAQQEGLKRARETLLQKEQLARSLKLDPHASNKTSEITNNEVKLISAQRQVKQLEKPDERIADIFQELKNRLDGLLTAQQRSAANVVSAASEKSSAATHSSLPPGKRPVEPLMRPAGSP